MATVKFPSEMSPATSIGGNDKLMISKESTGEAYQATFNQAKDYLAITGIELEPLVGGTTSGTALVVPNGPAGEQRTAEVASGLWYDFGAGPVQADASKRWKAYWNGSSWSLKDMGALPDSARIKEWVSGNYTSGDQRIYNGFIYEANKATSEEPSTGSDWDFKGKENDLSNKVIGVQNILKDGGFENGEQFWQQNEPIFDLSIKNGVAHIKTNNSENTGLMQGSIDLKAGTYNVEMKVKKVSSGTLYLTMGFFTPGINTLFTINTSEWSIQRAKIVIPTDTPNALALLVNNQKNVEFLIEYIAIYKYVENSINENVYESKAATDENTQAIEVLQTSVATSEWMPKPSSSKSTILSHIQPFVQKYLQRNSDVTLVKVADSIDTPLGWTDVRPDANRRPPFCNEYNNSSYLEEKLRWKEQQYRRFDNPGVITEILGGGTSSIVSTDTYWGAVGSSYYLPYTKVIEGGTDAGVSFKYPANMKRLSLIVHTDCRWSESQQITVAEGNGKVEVFNGIAWVEANGATVYFKEPETQPSPGIYRDNAQKRLKFRSLTNLSEKSITVKNVGAGRFGYWGLEYSPNEYMFTYINASKGSHSIEMIERYEPWMVDEFNPDLIVWQCQILNEALGRPDRSFGSKDYGQKFIDKYNEYVGKGYLVLPYAVWAAEYSNFVDESGNFLFAHAPNGDIITCAQDVDNIEYRFSQIGVPFLNFFHRITETAKRKGSNIYDEALKASGKNGNTFTMDGIHLNKTGQMVLWRFFEEYFNF